MLVQLHVSERRKEASIVGRSNVPVDIFIKTSTIFPYLGWKAATQDQKELKDDENVLTRGPNWVV